MAYKILLKNPYLGYEAGEIIEVSQGVYFSLIDWGDGIDPNDQEKEDLKHTQIIQNMQIDLNEKDQIINDLFKDQSNMIQKNNELQNKIEELEKENEELKSLKDKRSYRKKVITNSEEKTK